MPSTPVYLHDPWLGNISTRFEKQISSAVQRYYFAVEPRVVFTTLQLFTKKNVLLSHQCSNLAYLFVCHCNSRYVGRTSQRFQERIKQHIPKFSISSSRKSLPHRCKASSHSRQFHESAIAQHLLDNPVCASTYSDDKFSILARHRSLFHLFALKATFMKSLKPILCEQKEFLYSLKIS